MNRVVALLAVTVALRGGLALAQKPEAVALKRQGDNHLVQGAPDKAVAAYRKAIATDPDYMEGYEALSSHYLRTKQYSEAVTVLRQALGRSATYPEGWYNLAYALRKQGQLDAAIGAYRRFAQLRPRSADPHYGIGLAQQAKGEIKAAAQSFRRYAQLETNPSKKAWKEKALRLAQKLEGEAGVTPPAAPAPAPAAPPPPKPAAPAASPKPAPAAPRPIDTTLQPSASREDDSQPVTPQRERAMVFKAHGDKLTRQGRLSQAANSYRQAIREDYSYSAAYNELGTVLFGLKRYDDAIKTFRIAIRDNPDYHLGWYNLAYALRKAGRLLPAIAAYNKFIEAKPDDPDAYFGLALAHKTAGNKPEALKAFNRYIELERRQSQEQWVHKARVEVATLEGRPPPEYAPRLHPGAPRQGREDRRVPGKVIASAPAKSVALVPEAKPLTAKERQRLALAEKRRKLAEERKLKAEERKRKLEARRQARKAQIEAAQLARQERARTLKEKRRKAAEERARKAEERARKAEERRLARLGRKPAPVAAVAPPIPIPTVGANLTGVDPAPDVIVSPPMPGPPGSPGSTQSDRLRVQGDTLARSGKLPEAARLYIQAAKLDPFNTKAFDGLAYCAFKLGAYRQGARQVSRGLRDNPDYRGGWLHQARLFRAATDKVKAVGSYRKYLADRPEAVAVRLELARTLKSLNMSQQAVEAYQACLRPDRLAGNEAVVVAAQTELRGLGVTPPPVVAAGVAVKPRVAAVVPTLPAVPTLPTVPAQPAVKAKTPAQLKAEARRAAREAEKLARQERARALKEKRLKAAAERRKKLEARRLARKAQIEAALLARQERARELKEKRRTAAEERRRRLEARRSGRRLAVRRRGKDAPGTDIAEAVGQDMSEATPPVPPRTRMHDVLQPAPDAASAMVRVADEQFARKRYVVALGIYQQAARLDPGSSEPLYRAGVAAVAMGQMHLAADIFTQVLKIDPANGTARVNLQMAQAAARTSKPTADYVRTVLDGAKNALAQGRYALAEQQSSRALRQSVSPELHLLRAEARLAQRKPRQALADGGRALALDPAAAVALRVMADAHRQLGHRDRAIYYYRLYLSRVSNDQAAAAERSQIEQLISELSQGQ